MKWGLNIGVIILAIVTIGASLHFSAQNEKAKAEAIEQLSKTLKDPFSIKDGKVYYQDTLMEGVDTTSFEPLYGAGYSKDKNHVYFVTQIIKDADPATFEIKDNYLRDKNRVFQLRDSRIVEIVGADPKSYAPLQVGDFAKDDKHVFQGGVLIQNADPNTFQPISSSYVSYYDGSLVNLYYYSKDKNAVYFDAKAIPHSDPATFTPVKDQHGNVLYFKDKNQIYDTNEGVIVGSDPSTFRLLYSQYSQDAHAIYFATTSIPTANLSTFKLLGDGYAQDSKYIYGDGKIIFDLSKGKNPFVEAANALEAATPKDDTALDVIVASYYDLLLYYGNYSSYSLFDNPKQYASTDDFFAPFYAEMKDENRTDFWNWRVTAFPAFRLAFVAPDSPAFNFDFPFSGGAESGGEIVGRKQIDENTVLAYTRHYWQAYLGPVAGMCKESGDTIDQFIFKKVNGEWKIWDIKPDIDSWTTQNEGDTEEECKEFNQDKIDKYRVR